jgi:uncharacterized surface protein with fasciclin (FAS1) repeats
MRRTLSVVAAITLSLGLAACGSDDSTDEATPAETSSSAPATTEATEEAAAADIVDTAVAAGDFTTLAAALEAAGLVETLKGDGPFTVFAPTDEAFAKVPKETLDALAKDKAKLAKVLTYHVLTSKWSTDDIKLVKSTGTALGPAVQFGDSGGKLTVNGANVIQSDIDCTNGMIHVIDAVLLPPE